MYETFLADPYFNIPADMHMDSSDIQLDAVISKQGMSIAFYLHKSKNVQKNYMTTEKELLAIIKDLKQF